MRGGPCLATLAVVALAPAPAAAVDLTRVRPRAFPDCERLVRQHPRDLDAYRCFWALGSRTGRMKAARRALEGVLRRRPGEPRALLYLGIMEGLESRRGAEQRLRAAADGLARQGEGRGEIYARTSLAWNLIAQGRYRAARGELHRAERPAARLGNRTLRAMLHLWWGYLAFHEGDYARSAGWYQRAERLLFPGGPRWLQQRLLDWQAYLHRATGRHREAFEAFSREAELLRRDGNAHSRAFALYGVAYEAGHLVERGSLSKAEWLALRRQALAAARSAHNRTAEVDTRLLLLAAPSRDAREAVRQIRIAQGLLREMRDYPKATVERLLAKALWVAEPERRAEALRLSESALLHARARPFAPRTVAVLLDHAWLHRQAGRRAAAFRHGLAALDLMDRLRGMQPEPMVRARVSAGWAHAYPLVAGWAVDGLGAKPDLDLAFRVLERLRARSLLEAFERAAPWAAGATSRNRAEVLGRITYLQRQLLGHALAANERARLLAELSRQEARERALLDDLARLVSEKAGLPRAPAQLVEVQRALAPDQAMLLFSVVPTLPHEARLLEGAESFVLSVTRAGVLAHRLRAGPSTKRIAQLLPAAVARRDGSEKAASVRLYRDLLGAALASLPPGVRRLVLVPDAGLSGVPYDLLRPSIASAPLGDSFQISLAPSATLWLRWRSHPARVPAAVLALADPALPASRSPARAQDAAPWLVGLRLGRLPHGAREAATAVRALSGGGLLLTGSKATERRLKSIDLGSFGVLHLAAHAIMDEVHPERSAVVLAAGGAGEDGLLQEREIATLDLRGRLVVLPACSSSSGTILRGEGMLSLTRSFLQAGARAVIGSWWPLRDDDAEALIGAFYRHLAAGQSAAGALAGARRERIRAGAPAAAWAGLVLVGDGDLAFPPSSRVPWGLWAGAGAGFAVLALGFSWRRRRRRARRRRDPTDVAPPPPLR